MTVEPTTKDKQITVDVPEDRVAEFYAFYGRFLAGFPGRRRRGRGPHGHRCGPHRDDRSAAETATRSGQPQPERARPDVADA
jgi:hypothetical protein